MTKYNNHYLCSNEIPIFENVRDSRGTGSVGSRYDALEDEQGSEAMHEPAHGVSDTYSEADSVHLSAESIEAHRYIEVSSASAGTNVSAENTRIVLANGTEMSAFAHELIVGRNQSDDPWVGIDLIMPDIVTAGSAPQMHTRPLPLLGHPATNMTGSGPSDLPKFTGGLQHYHARTFEYPEFTKRVGRTLSAAAVLAAGFILAAFGVYGADMSSMAIYALLLLLVAVLTVLQRFWRTILR